MRNLYAIFAKFLDIRKQITDNLVNGLRLFHLKNDVFYQCPKFQAFICLLYTSDAADEL